jgi:hypothetical protein
LAALELNDSRYRILVGSTPTKATGFQLIVRYLALYLGRKQMAFNQENLDNKLQSIIDKNLEAITAEQPYIPFLDSGFSQAQLETWLGNVQDRLEDIDANKYSEAQIITIRTTLYNQLSETGKLIADIIIGATGEIEPECPSANDWIRLCGIRIIQWVYFS